MKVDINLVEQGAEFGDLKQGECFVSGGEAYMRLDGSRSAAKLRTGRVVLFDILKIVYPRRMKVVLDD